MQSKLIFIGALCIFFGGSGNTWTQSTVGKAKPKISGHKLIDAHLIEKGFDNRQKTQVIVNLTRQGLAARPDFSSEQSRAALRQEIKAHQQALLDKLPVNEVKLQIRFENISAFSAEVSEGGLKALQNDPNVDVIEPVRILEAHLAQGIPLMKANTYRSTYNGSGMAIAICDTGVDYTHPRLGGGGFPNSKVIGGYNFGDNNANPIPQGEAHGTACAGIAAGDLGTTGDYIGGVAYNAKIYALKISPADTGSSDSAKMIGAWDWCVTHKNDDPNNPIMVISTSFGGGRNFATCDSSVVAMTAAANAAVAAGITLAVSSGNDGYCDSMGWPACISSVISVGAVYDAAFGTYQPCLSTDSCAPKTLGGCSSGAYATDATAADKVTSYSNTANFLHVLAPANACSTADIVGSSGYSTGDYATSFGGTSAACPYVAGAIASLQSAAKAITGNYLSPEQVRSKLMSEGDLIADTKVAITKPRVNLERAIQSLVPSLSAPILNSEPSITPGTANTIAWSAVSRPNASEVEVQNETASTAMNASETFSIEEVSVTISPENISFATHVVQDEFETQDIENIFTEGFEGAFPGTAWSLSGSPTWNDVSFDKNSGSWSGWCAGSSVSPANGYVDGMDSHMVYGPFDLSDATSAQVTFSFRNDSEANFDFFQWFASTNGSNFSGYQVSGNQDSWRSQTFSLTNVPSYGNLAGKSQVWIMFRFVSDGSVSGSSGYAGAFLDDIVIQKETPSNIDLTTYQPGHWNDKIPIGTNQLSAASTHNYAGSYYDNQTLYFNWASINNGQESATGYNVRVEVTGTGGGTWNWTSITTEPTYYTHLVNDQPVGPLAAGSHTFRLWIDHANTVSESNEINNYYERTINVLSTIPTEYYAESATNSSFSSPTGSGWITNTQHTFTGLTPGRTYYYRVKARKNGSESAWSNTVFSQQEALPLLSITPGSHDFGSIQIGGTVDQTFNVANIGGGSLSGSASTASPFSILSGGSYNLSAGQTQQVTIRFSPLAANTYNGIVVFTGGTGSTNSVTGISTNVVITPATFSSVQKSAGNIQFTISGDIGRVYVIQYSPNLGSWYDLRTITNTTGTMLYAEPLTNAVRFYRAYAQ